MKTTMRRCDKTLWVRANWTDLIGLPTPDADPWMMQDTPLSRSALEHMKTNEFVKRAGTKEREATRTARGTKQMTYRTDRHESVFDRIDRAAVPVSRGTAETFAARPDAAGYVVELFAEPGRTVAGELTETCSEEDLDVQLVGVGEEEPDAYPGRFIEADREDLLDASSPIIRAVPTGVDVLVMHAGVAFSAVAAAVLGRTPDSTRRLVNPPAGELPGVLRDALLVTNGDGPDVPRRPHRERPENDEQRMLSHFDPGVVVAGDVTLDGGDDGQATLTGLTTDRARTDGGSDAF